MDIKKISDQVDLIDSKPYREIIKIYNDWFFPT